MASPPGFIHLAAVAQLENCNYGVKKWNYKENSSAGVTAPIVPPRQTVVITAQLSMYHDGSPNRRCNLPERPTERDPEMSVE